MTSLNSIGVIKGNFHFWKPGGLVLPYFQTWGTHVVISSNLYQNIIFDNLWFSKGQKWFSFKIIPPGTNSAIFWNSRDYLCQFWILRGKSVIFSNFITQGLILIIFDFYLPWVDFSFVLNFQGLVLPNFETWGTETANCANFVRFSFVFKHFASKTYKTHFWDNLCILMRFWVFLDVLAVQIR